MRSPVLDHGDGGGRGLLFLRQRDQEAWELADKLKKKR
jgi:hypothetical protein